MTKKYKKQKEAYEKGMDDLKEYIKKLYRSGDTITEISEKVGRSRRVVYYHLGTLSPDEKAEHAKERAKRS